MSLYIQKADEAGRVMLENGSRESEMARNGTAQRCLFALSHDPSKGSIQPNRCQKLTKSRNIGRSWFKFSHLSGGMQFLPSA
jgi:hypothetical protein